MLKINSLKPSIQRKLLTFRNTVRLILKLNKIKNRLLHHLAWFQILQHIKFGLFKTVNKILMDITLPNIIWKNVPIKRLIRLYSENFWKC